MRAFFRPSRVVTVLAGSCALLVMVAGLAAQAPPPPPPPPPPGLVGSIQVSARPPVGTARIAGSVTTTEAMPKPLRRATVTLRDTDRSATRTTMTDDGGRFAFDRLADGRYTVSVTKPSYVPMTYGSRTRGGPGLTIALAPGQQVGDVSVPLAKGGVITGRVVDDLGRPAPTQRVSVSERVVAGGQTQQRSVGFGTTDDRGVYRIFGLPPGTFDVAVQPQIGFGVGAARVTTADEVRWATSPSTAAAGSTQPATAAPPRGRALRYAPVFYPSAAELAASTPISLAAGEERGGIDITVSLMPTAIVSGTAARADGQPLRGAIVTAVREAAGGPGLIELVAPAQVSAQGAFTISGLLPGRYLLTARASDQTSGRVPSFAEAAVSQPGNLWALESIEVRGDDLTGVRLTLAPGMGVSGRVVFESATTSPPANVNTLVTLALTRPPGSGAGLGTGVAQVDAAGAFTFTGVPPGSFFIAPALRNVQLAGGAVPAWMLKSATLGGRDVLDSTFDVLAGADTRDVVVTITDRVTQIAGLVTDGAGRPVPTYSVIVFSVDPRYWRQGSRWVRQPVRPATDGRYAVNALPPGEYYVAVVNDFQPNEWFTPAFLQQVVPGAIRVVLGDGERKTQDLKLAGG